MINSLIKQHKGFAFFLFVFIFFYSGILRGVITTDAVNGPPSSAHHDSETKSNLSLQHNHFNGFGIANQYKDNCESEIDETSIDFEFSFTSSSPITFLPFPNFRSSNELNFGNSFKQPLYDLFCAWKFHLI